MAQSSWLVRGLKIVHYRFGRWAASGVLGRVFNKLAADYDNEHMMIDATIVRAHQHSAGARKNGEQAIGRSRGGLTTRSTSSSTPWAIASPYRSHPGRPPILAKPSLCWRKSILKPSSATRRMTPTL